MHRFNVYTKKVNTEREQTFCIADLIPIGRDNAISRKLLTDKCISAGLIDKNISDKDRAKAAFRNHALAKKLYEDYKAGRIKDDVDCHKKIHKRKV